MRRLPGGAGLSKDRVYRYVLWREVNPEGEGSLLWVMLNPSTADETEPDATITRCVDFTRRWGFRYLVVVNLYAFRSKDPKKLKVAGSFEGAIGPENDLAICWAASFCQKVVCAWGANEAGPRARHVVKHFLSDRLFSFEGITKNGQPLHPLRLSRLHRLFPFDTSPVRP